MVFRVREGRAKAGEAATRPTATKILAGPAPTAARLYEAALRHLARFSATEAGLVQVLARRIDRWARRAAGEMQDRDRAEVETASEAITATAGVALADAREVAARLVATGVIDDALFAASRTRRLRREGRSARAVGAHLASRGVDAETAREAVPNDEATELVAALAAARRRRIGPFRRAETIDKAARMKELAMLARGGFSHAIARTALAMDAEDAETMLIQSRLAP